MRTKLILIASMVLGGCAHAPDVKAPDPQPIEAKRVRWARGTVVYAYYVEDDSTVASTEQK